MTAGRSRFDVRPLDRITSIRTKFGLVIVLAMTVSGLAAIVAVALGVNEIVALPIAMVIALATVRLVARGMTSPLRDMEEAAAAIARGDYDRRVVTSSRDEVGRLAAEFNAMAEELAATDRLRRDLVANVSHELRTPISALQAHLENLVDGVEPADPEVLRTMLAQTERLGRMVSRLLDLSRLESGGSPLHLEPVTLAGVLDAVATEMRLHHPDRVVVVTVDPPGLALDADAERLHQVVVNLVENAARYSPPDQPVEVTAAAGPRGVVLEVADRGPGIPVAERARVFERFHRTDAARAAERGGAGLGLAIARWIVELHGGTIRADGRDGGGCRMVVELPATRLLR